MSTVPVIVSVTAAECYRISHGWSWAHIYVRHGADDRLRPADQPPRYWVEVAVVSDYGEFGHHWSHIGDDWRGFLASLGFDYALGKMLGPRLRDPLDGYEAAEQAKGVVLDRRRQGGIDGEDARKLWDAIAEADKDAGCTVFLRDWDRLTDGLVYQEDLFTAGVWHKASPQARAFWAEIWPHFIEAITTPPPAAEAAA